MLRLREKVSQETRVRRRCDMAQTAFVRRLASKLLSEAKPEALEQQLHSLNPGSLGQTIYHDLAQLLQPVDRSVCDLAA